MHHPKVHLLRFLLYRNCYPHDPLGILFFIVIMRSRLRHETWSFTRNSHLFIVPSYITRVLHSAWNIFFSILSTETLFLFSITTPETYIHVRTLGPPASAGADVTPISNNAAKSFIGLDQLLIIYTKKGGCQSPLCHSSICHSIKCFVCQSIKEK